MQRDDYQQEWLTLDNAARIYPASLSEWSPDVYRISVTFGAPIRVSALDSALRTVFPRFPYFQVHLRRGLFWYYLQRDDEIPELCPMSGVPVSVMPMQRGSCHLLRVQARGATIAVDFSHVLTDGAGALRFLGTLATQYLRLRGVRVTRWEPFLDPDEPPSPGEYEDAYNKYFDRGLPGPSRLSAAYHLPGEAQSRFRVITGRMPVGDMLALARGHRVSLTTYLVALYMHSLAQVRDSGTDKEGKTGSGILRVEVPVDMRRLYPSETMRNFSLFVSPEIDMGLGAYSFDEIVQRVHHSMSMQVDRKELARQIARNVRAERNPFIRIMPLFLKDLLFSYVRERIGESPYSGVITNLGRIAVPEGIDTHVESFGVMLGPNPRMKKNCAVLSFRDDLYINFGSVIESRDLERLFFAHMARAGVRVIVAERSSDT
ncbi:hypothetical protein KKG45_13525 [bacterium]|nr:hypothetical protein [bacterium]MBU1074261.1 hypothetical protein [bacterium]MBU1677012.1 hypothetical protein [bacterium]